MKRQKSFLLYKKTVKHTTIESDCLIVVHDMFAGKSNVYTVYEVPGYLGVGCCQPFHVVGRELDLKTIMKLFGRGKLKRQK